MASFTIEEIHRATGAGHLAADASVAACTGVSTDTRTIAPGHLFVALVGDRFDGHDFLEAAAEKGAMGAVVAKDHPKVDAVRGRLALFEVFDTLRALGDLAGFHRARFPSLPVVAITGSNGKTTTKELTFAALEAALGPGLKTEGNLNNLIGVPLTLLRLEGTEKFAVVEMGMNAPGEIARLTEIAWPKVGVVTGAGPVHLEGLGTVDRVAQAKAELYRGLADGATAVVNLDDPRMPALARAAGAGDRMHLFGFGTAEDADVRVLEVRPDPAGAIAFTVALSPRLGGGRLPVSLELVGTHNAANAAAALAVTAALHADVERAATGIAQVKTVGRRLRRAAGPSGSLVLDDCYNANLLSMEAALATGAALAEARGGRLVAALGDMLELGPAEPEMHRRLGELAARYGTSRLVAFGPRCRTAADAARGAGAGEVLDTEDPVVAADFLARGLDARDVVLVKGSRGMKMERIVERLEVPAEATATVRGGSR